MCSQAPWQAIQWHCVGNQHSGVHQGCLPTQTTLFSWATMHLHLQDMLNEKRLFLNIGVTFSMARCPPSEINTETVDSHRSSRSIQGRHIGGIWPEFPALFKLFTFSITSFPLTTVFSSSHLSWDFCLNSFIFWPEYLPEMGYVGYIFYKCLHIHIYPTSQTGGVTSGLPVWPSVDGFPLSSRFPVCRWQVINS